MIITSDQFKGSKVAKTFVDPEYQIKKTLSHKLQKGIISKDLYDNAIKELDAFVKGESIIKSQSDDLSKGEIMDKLGYGYGNNEAIKFTKTGKELKELMPSVIAKLSSMKTVLVGQMSAYKTLAGVEPIDDRYDWKMCETYDEVQKKYLEPTDQQKACRAYNDCCYKLRSIDEDLKACQTILVGIDDKQKYNLTIGQLMALNVDGALNK